MQRAVSQIVYKAYDINELPGRIKKIRDRKYQAMKRNPEDTDFAEDFEKFSDLAKRIRKAYRTQTISEQRYLAWGAEAEASDITPNFNFN